MIKIIKYFLLFLLLLIIATVSYFVFESLNVKKGTEYNNLEKVPYISWLNIRSGIFGLVLKATIGSTLATYDETKYISINVPSKERFNEYPEVSLYYLVNGVKIGEDNDTKLVDYPAVFRTRFRKKDYLILLQGNMQKNKKTGYVFIVYPTNLIQTKTVGQFIDMFDNRSFPAPIFSGAYKFSSVEICNQKFNDKDYCNWLFSKQNAIYKIIRKWGDTGIVPIDIMRYPLIINQNKI